MDDGYLERKVTAANMNPDLLHNAMVRWSQQAFLHEIQTDFSRARQFDGFISKWNLAAMLRLPPAKIQLLAQALPTGAGDENPVGKKRLELLLPDQKEAVVAYQTNRRMQPSEREDEFARNCLRKKQQRSEAAQIKKVGIKTLKRILRESGVPVKTDAMSASLLRVAYRKSWGELVVQWDFESAFQFDCRFLVYDENNVNVRFHDHYLGLLGIAQSAWAVGSESECADKVKIAFEHVVWLLNEYEKIIDELLSR